MISINDKILHLKELGYIENMLFNEVLSPEEFYKSLEEYFKSNPEIVNGKYLTRTNMKRVDEFIESYLTRIESAKVWLIRAYVIGRLLAESDLSKTILNLGNIEDLPSTIQDLAKKYNLSFEEAKALENVIEGESVLLTNTTQETKQTVINTLIENTKKGGSEKSLYETLKEKITSDPGELNRDWQRVAITEANTMFNNGYLGTLKEGDFLTVIVMPDCCPSCDELFRGKVFRYTKEIPPDYSTIPESDPEYDRLSDLWDMYVWVGKNNYGRSSSRRKRIIKELGNKKDNLREKHHHEHSSPCCPAHPECRCRYMKINIEYQYVDTKGNIRLRIENEEEWREFYDELVDIYQLEKSKPLIVLKMKKS